jgi:Tripartite tricarboxylate transporter TctB family
MNAAPGRFPHVRLARSTAEAATALVVFCGSLYLLDLTFDFTHATKAGYAGSALFPQIALGLLILCAGKLMLEWLLRRKRGLAADATAAIDLDIAGLVPIIAIAIAYALLLERAGFELCTFALMLILLGRRMRLVYAVLMSALATLTIYAVFALLLQVDLPLLFLPAVWPF